MVGYEDGTVQILLYNSNFEIAYTADASNSVNANNLSNSVRTRKDLGKVTKIIFLDDHFITKRHENAHLLVVQNRSSLNYRYETFLTH